MFRPTLLSLPSDFKLSVLFHYWISWDRSSTGLETAFGSANSMFTESTWSLPDWAVDFVSSSSSWLETKLLSYVALWVNAENSAQWGFLRQLMSTLSSSLNFKQNKADWVWGMDLPHFGWICRLRNQGIAVLVFCPLQCVLHSEQLARGPCLS